MTVVVQCRQRQSQLSVTSLMAGSLGPVSRFQPSPCTLLLVSASAESS